MKPKRTVFDELEHDVEKLLGLERPAKSTPPFSATDLEATKGQNDSFLVNSHTNAISQR